MTDKLTERYAATPTIEEYELTGVVSNPWVMLEDYRRANDALRTEIRDLKNQIENLQGYVAGRTQEGDSAHG